MNRKFILFFVLLLWALSGCQPNPQQAANGDQTIIDDPTDGSTLPLGPVRINVHAEDAVGLATIRITVNGQTLQTSSLQGATTRSSAYMSTVWTPAQVGSYSIEAMAVDLQGEKGPLAHVNVTITAAGASSSAQPTAAEQPAFVSTIPAAAPAVDSSGASGAPTPVPTPVRLAGAITTPGHTSPLLLAPIKTNLVPCSSLTLSWQAQTDANTTKYDVELQKIVGKDAIPIQTWNDLADTHVSFTPECNLLYRWRVRGKGDSGSLDWSDYEDFRTGPTLGK